MGNRLIMDRSLTHEEESLLFRAVRRVAGSDTSEQRLAKRDEAWMRFLLLSGIRINRLVTLTVEEARAAIRSKYLSLPSVKRGQPGQTYLTNKARRALKDLLAVRREMGFNSEEGPLVMSRKEQGMSKRSFEARVSYWREQADLTVAVTPHWFRHTYAKRFLQRTTHKDPHRILQSQLNHADPRSTTVYTQPDRDEIEQAMEENG